jgi:hypothetical protein
MYKGYKMEKNNVANSQEFHHGHTMFRSRMAPVSLEDHEKPKVSDLQVPTERCDHGAHYVTIRNRFANWLPSGMGIPLWLEKPCQLRKCNPSETCHGLSKTFCTEWSKTLDREGS